MLTATAEEIGTRAAALAEQLAGHAVFEADVVDGVSTVGSGGAPGSALPTKLVRLTPRGGSTATLEPGCVGFVRRSSRGLSTTVWCWTCEPCCRGKTSNSPRR